METRIRFADVRCNCSRLEAPCGTQTRGTPCFKAIRCLKAHFSSLESFANTLEVAISYCLIASPEKFLFCNLIFAEGRGLQSNYLKVQTFL